MFLWEAKTDKVTEKDILSFLKNMCPEVVEMIRRHNLKNLLVFENWKFYDVLEMAITNIFKI